VPLLKSLIEKIEAGSDLSRTEAESAMEEILSGRAVEDLIVALLSALRTKGETVAELVGFARAMRRHATPIFDDTSRPDELLVDTCGTGGDASGTFNISTAAAFVAAGAGVRVAKHGNRSISSKCGSADVLEALGISLDVPPDRIGAAIREIGIGFLFAPAMHTAMRHAMSARRRLGRTAFNLLGPLTNPAGARAQVVGVFSGKVVEKVALVLSELGVERAFVVHGAGGLDRSGQERHVPKDDHAVEAVVYKYHQAAKQLGEGFHRSPPGVFVSATRSSVRRPVEPKFQICLGSLSHESSVRVTDYAICFSSANARRCSGVGVVVAMNVGVSWSPRVRH